MVPNGLCDLMDRHEIIVSVVVSRDTDEKQVVGDRTALESDYVVRTLFDDLTVQQIFGFLEGQILPRLVQQGKVCGIIYKPTENTVVGLYYHDERNVIQRYQKSIVVDSKLRELWTQ